MTNTEVARLVEEAQRITTHISSLNLRLYTIKAKLHKLAPGHYGPCTIFDVKASKVPAHTRKAHSAIRVNIGGG